MEKLFWNEKGVGVEMGAIWSEVWKAFLLIIVGMLLLRVSGRKSISQMTVPTTITMISIGTVIVQPIANHSILLTIIAAVVFILVLFLAESIQVRWNAAESFIKGPAILVIREGQLQPQNLKKLRMTVDALEMQLRQQGISNMSDVKTATIEPNGGLGYELFDWAKPITYAQMEALLAHYLKGAPPPNETNRQSNNAMSESNLFAEIENDNRHVSRRTLH